MVLQFFPGSWQATQTAISFREHLPDCPFHRFPDARDMNQARFNLENNRYLKVARPK